MSFYTAPIKALVSEKFFALIEVFGADNVGMLTGDAAVNPDAPIICCTAEVLANIALREGRSADVGLVVMDEFHFYSEHDRGWAWQVPLLELVDAQFLLMSATLGDVSFFVEDLKRRTGRDTAVVDDAERPVPLSFRWSMEPLDDTLEELVTTGQDPVYVVHFTQAAAVEHATNLLKSRLGSSGGGLEGRQGGDRRAGSGRSGSAPASARRCRGWCAAASASTTPACCRSTAGSSRRSPRPGCCASSAAPTPWASASTCRSAPCCSPAWPSSTAPSSGCSGRGSSSRSPAGPAARATTRPATSSYRRRSYVIENEQAKAKIAARQAAGKKKSKAQLKKAPEGTVVWTEQTFDKLVAGVPERLTSRMKVDNAMLVNVVTREEDAFAVMRRLVTDNHEERRGQLRLARRALRLSPLAACAPAS